MYVHFLPLEIIKVKSWTDKGYEVTKEKGKLYIVLKTHRY